MAADVAESVGYTVIHWEDVDLYRFFALALGPPTQECFNSLSQPGIDSALRDLWARLKCEGGFPGFEWFRSYQEYESAYITLFDVGVPEPPVPLFESAHDKTRPAQEAALENTYFYDVLGLRSDPGRGVPDYLITQLEFLSALRYTAEHTVEEATAVGMLRAEVEFIERHLLNWIPLAASKLGKLSALGFPVLMTLLMTLLSRRRDAVGL